MRYALIASTDTDVIQKYLPTGYRAYAIPDATVIQGVDNAGWTLDDYVIPRLASGLYFAREITSDEFWSYFE